jgi:CheY-like chemotaxis protein
VAVFAVSTFSSFVDTGKFWETNALCVAYNMLGSPQNAMLLRRDVLISDDDECMREMLACWFEGAGYRAAVVQDGRELLAALDSRARLGKLPDVVISDVRMPVMDGLSALSRIQDEFPELPVVMITAFGDGRTHRRARELGAAAVLDKPFDLSELSDMVDQLLATNTEAQ